MSVAEMSVIRISVVASSRLITECCKGIIGKVPIAIVDQNLDKATTIVERICSCCLK